MDVKICMEKIDQIKIGERIKGLRKESGLTQKELADKINLSQNMVSSLEKGVSTMSIKTLIQLCSVFKCSADYILGFED